MDRRSFLGSGIGGAVTVGVLVGGYYLFRLNTARAREELNAHLLEDALQPLTAGSVKQIQTLPVRAREEIRRFFHGKCLNTEGFCSYICSDSFRETLKRCTTPDDRHACLLAAFCGHIATEDEILNQLDTIATEIGSELDADWDRYCREISSKWNIRVKEHGKPFTTDELQSRVTGMIRSDLTQALKDADKVDQAPALGQTVGNIGKSAVMLLPLVRFGNVGLLIGVPLFVVLAGTQVWDYVAGCLDDRRGDIQGAISARIASLGNRIAAEFEREVRQRLSDLHYWQEQSVRKTAGQVVVERV